MWFTEQEFISCSAIEDLDLNEIFQELRQYNSNWYMKRHVFTVRGFFKITYIIQFSIYYRGKYDEVQVINFYTPKSGINIRVSKEIAIAYLMGLLNGYQQKSLS